MSEITLTPEQRTAILKIFRELVSRDIRSLRELLHSIPGGRKKVLISSQAIEDSRVARKILMTIARWALALENKY